MKKGIKMSPVEFSELIDLMKVVKDKTNLPGIRRLAMAEFDKKFQNIKRKNGSN